MSEPFIAEIRIFAGDFAPRNWAFCDGQLLPIAQNTALFSLIGTTYGGDGRTTTALPDLQGRAPMHPGRGPGLTDRRLGESGGSETATLTMQSLPNHIHGLSASGLPGNASGAAGNVFARTVGANPYVPWNDLLTFMAPEMLSETGGGQPHNNMQPFLAINFIIALQGLYPTRD
jgi:microcystin-dependent protein